MCGRFNVIDSPEVHALLKELNIQSGQLRYIPDAAPGSVISIVIDGPDGHILTDALWWLLLDADTLKPNYHYATFNSRWDKLNSKGSLAFQPYRSSRCIIAASAFVEGLGDGKTYHKIELEGSAIAFGGLYKHYIHRQTGESVYAASIITLGPVPQWQNVHPKSHPLILPADDPVVLNAWLNKDNNDVSPFDPLLESRIRKPQRITPIGRPSKWNAIGESWIIPADTPSSRA
jgi:putative SOS response-associated peptidase YedK